MTSRIGGGETTAMTAPAPVAATNAIGTVVLDSSRIAALVVIECRAAIDGQPQEALDGFLRLPNRGPGSVRVDAGFDQAVLDETEDSRPMEPELFGDLLG